MRYCCVGNWRRVWCDSGVRTCTVGVQFGVVRLSVV